MFNGNNNGHHSNGTEQRPRTREQPAPYWIRGQRAKARRRDSMRPPHDLLWDGLSPVCHQRTRTAPRPGPRLPAQGAAAVRVFDYLEGHVVIDQANRDLRIAAAGAYDTGRRRDSATRSRRSIPRLGEVKVTAQAYSCAGAWSPSRARCPAYRHRLPRRG